MPPKAIAGTTVLVSSTEPPSLRSIGLTSGFPETRGVDVLVYPPDSSRTWGCQRKTVPDFILSVSDGRLTRELALMQTLPHKSFLLEGPFKFNHRGKLTLVVRDRTTTKMKTVETHISRGTLRKMLWSIRYIHGVDITISSSLRETRTLWLEFAEYLSTSHTGFYSRPQPKKNPWGKAPDTHTLKLYFLQGLPGKVGVKTAENLLVRGGGRIPLRWTLSVGELEKVPLIGKTKARVMWEFLNG